MNHNDLQAVAALRQQVETFHDLPETAVDTALLRTLIAGYLSRDPRWAPMVGNVLFRGDTEFRVIRTVLTLDDMIISLSADDSDDEQVRLLSMTLAEFRIFAADTELSLVDAKAHPPE